MLCRQQRVKRSWRQWSLRAQLTLGLLVGLLLLGTVTALALFVFFERFQQHLSQQLLDDNIERLLTAIVQRDGELQLDLSRIDPAYQRPLSGDYFLIRLADRTWRSRSLWDFEMPANASANTEEGAFQRLEGPAGQKLLQQSRSYQRFAQTLHITVASNYAPLSAEFRRALWQFTGLWLLALVLAVAAMQFYVRLALQPLQRARNELQAVREGRETFLNAAVPLELEPLITQINHLLEHTRGTLLRSRTALGNFGHALKTPLAVLTHLVERPELDAHAQLQTQLREQLELIAMRVRRELAQAQSAADSQAFEPFVPEPDLHQLVAALEKAHGRSLVVRWDISAVNVLGLDRADMLEIFGNILDNAWKWAHSMILVQITVQDHCWIVRVEDDGPGIENATDRQIVLLRGGRLDESTAGQGLGLAIVADMAQAYGGDLTLTRSALGGLCVRVSLPQMLAVVAPA